MDEEKKSNGHICFSGKYEYFWSPSGNDVFRVERTNHVNESGYRIGARFVSTKAAWEALGHKLV